LVYKISHWKMSEIKVKAKFCGFHFHGKFCFEKSLTTSVLWKNFDQKVVSVGKGGIVAGNFGFSAAFLRIVWAFHFCSMWILTSTAFHSPKVHFHVMLIFSHCVTVSWSFFKTVLPKNWYYEIILKSVFLFFATYCIKLRAWK
jgi:hypothetical protein